MDLLFRSLGIISAGDLATGTADVLEGHTSTIRSLVLAPDFLLARENLGLALTQTGVTSLQAGRLDAAIDNLQEALKNDPTLVQAHSNLGIALAQKGAMEEALAQFQEALRLNPDDRAAQTNLTKIEAMVQQKEPSP